MPITAYPLAWPLHKPRTDQWKIEHSGFDRKRTLATSRDLLVNEVKLLRGTGLIVSSNIPLRLDGLPRSGYAAPRDAGVAIYFKRDKQDMAFACDRWDRVEDNIYAIAKTIDALRGVARLFLLELPLRADFSLINARRADHIGNLTYAMTARNFNPLMAMAADLVIAESQEIVPVGVIAPDDVMTPAVLVDRLVAKERVYG